MEQPALAELETLLHDLGFDPGKVDGLVDDETIAAIRRYQDFALLTGDPTPSKALLNELRGVAAAFAALGGSPATQEAEAVALSQPETTAPETAVPEAAPEAKVLVPPPPVPPKLKPLEAAVEEEYKLTEPPRSPADDPPGDEALPPDGTIDQALLSDPAVLGDNPPAEEAVSEEQNRIEAELAPYREALDRGNISREELARQFNVEGRKLLEAADYELAVVKFSVAIFLDPDFAGAYSNRGTAYQRQEEAGLALKDFDKARELGFGGIRLPNQKTPLR